MMDTMTDFEMNLPVAFIREGGKVIAYTPALDISTVGKNDIEAKQRFGEMVNLFIADLVENKTVDSVLSGLGWIKNEQKWNPPAISQESVRVRVPAFA